MIVTVQRARIVELMAGREAGYATALMREADELAQYSPDFGQLLEDLATELHRVQLHQLVPGFTDEASRVDAAALAAQLSPEVVQLWFQMALNGRRDLGLAPSARAGLEMTLLRMLAFRPAAIAEGEAATRAASAPAKSSAPAASASVPRREAAPATPSPSSMPPMPAPAPAV